VRIDGLVDGWARLEEDFAEGGGYTYMYIYTYILTYIYTYTYTYTYTYAYTYIVVQVC